MRAPAVSFAKRFVAAFMAALLTFTLVPASALAEGEDEVADASTEGSQEVGVDQVDGGSGSTPVASTAEGGTLASALVGAPTTFINSDVALDGEPIVGSFTVDGLTFAVTGGSDVELVGVSPDWQQVAEPQKGDGSPVAPMLASGPDGPDADSSALALPESVTYEGIDYAVTSIGAYAFYLSGVTAVELPASVTDVDDRAFRSSDVASVAVADGNPTYSSFDGALYSADQSSLLLIPEGKQGTVLLPSTAESAAPSVFSHCSLVTQIAVEEGSAAFASENGLLYDASLTTLLRVPAGATDIAIHDGCTTIAAGALEACASLATITAPASVTSISPDVLHCPPLASVPAASALGDTAEGGSDGAEHVSAIVALGTSDAELPDVDPASISVSLSEGASAQVWEDCGFSIAGTDGASIDEANEADPGTSAEQLDGSQNIVADDEPTAEYPGKRIYSDVVLPAVRYADDGFVADDQADIPITSLSTASTARAASDIGVICKTDPYLWRYSYGSAHSDTRYNANVLHKMSSPAVACQSIEICSYSSSNSLLGVAGHHLEDYSETAYYVSNSTWGWYICTSSSKNIAYNTGATITWANGTTEPMYRRNPSTNRGYYTPQPGMTITLHRNIDVLISLYGKDGDNSALIGTTSGLSQSAPPSVTVPTRTGYAFDGYYTSANGGGTKWYNANGTAALTTITTTYPVTLYAKWTAKNYTITWNANGGSVSPASSTKAYDSTLGTLPTPTRTGYAFAGWFTAATGGNQISTSTKVAGNVTYYAHWTANSYTVEYWNKAGTTKLSSDTGFKYDTARNLAAKPTSGVNAGYTAVGWSGSTNQSTATYGFSSSQKNLATSGTKKLYLAETANTITLTWNSQGGSAVANTSATYSSSAKVPMPSGNPTKTGYTFKGWFTAASGGTQVTSNTALPTTNTTYHAQWTANSYTVEYWNKAGTTRLSSDTGFKYDTARNLAAKPTSGVTAGYTAVGWSSSANQSTATYGFSSSQKNMATSGTKKLYLAETANTIRTTWNYNGGAIDGNAGSTYRDIVYASGKKLGDALDSDFWAEGRLARSGYRFAGWFTAASGGTQVSASTALPTANATYYAHWVPAGPLVSVHASSAIYRSFDLSDGEGTQGAFGAMGTDWSPGTWVSQASIVQSQLRLEGTHVPYPAESSLKAGLASDGTGVTSAWLVTGDAEGRKSGSWLSSSATSIAGAASADVYLNGYGASTITWDAGEGECATERTEDVMPYATATAPAASRKGYIMAGWYDGEGDEAKLACKPGGQTPQVTEDVTYHAKWVPSVSAVAPIEATVRLDILGTEEQAMDEEAPGYIESRCGEPLDVAEVAFEAKAGATELFGSHVPDIELQALPGEDASWATGSPAFSFALDAAGGAAIESDAARLAPFAMAGYEVRIPISYRFRIPDELLEEVLAAIDPARFEQVTTPVCSVVYTVALASQEGGEEGA